MHPMACTDLALCTDTVWKHKSTPDDLNKGRKRAVQHEHGDGSMLAMLQIMNKKRCTVAAPGMYIRPHLSIPACNGRTYLPGPGFSIKHRIRFHTCDPAFKDVPVSAAAVPSKGIVMLKMTKHWHRSQQKEQFMETERWTEGVYQCICNTGMDLETYLRQFHPSFIHPLVGGPVHYKYGQGYEEFDWVVKKVLNKFPGSSLYRRHHPITIVLSLQDNVQQFQQWQTETPLPLYSFRPEQLTSFLCGHEKAEKILNRLVQLEAWRCGLTCEVLCVA